MNPRSHAPAELIGLHQAGVWRSLRLLGCDAATADDLTQETFLAVLRRPFDDRGERPTLRYLCTVARNLFLKSKRQDQLPSLDDPTVVEALEDRFAKLCPDGGHVYLEALRQCLEGLETRARTALELVYGSDAGRTDVGAKLDLGADGVKSLLRRSRQMLKSCIERRLQ